ncbi:hypothetical protein [Methylobacterium tarhaniae]|uniref:hypothetical protein n=1 Tax=Methylobacterium tarhaniae TaxID=1187852 RepID=UPI0012EE6290|nr:hypothetical protein [Methylobacterium tarhaniae]
MTKELWSAMLHPTIDLAGRSSVFAGIERPSITEVLILAEQAQRAGAVAIMITASFGSKVDQHETLRHLEQLHDNVDLDICSTISSLS